MWRMGLIKATRVRFVQGCCLKRFVKRYFFFVELLV